MSTKISVLSEYGFVPVRHSVDEDRDWINMNGFCYSLFDVQVQAYDDGNDILNWDKANPVVRCVNVIVIEVTPGMTLDIRIPGKLGTERITIE